MIKNYFSPKCDHLFLKQIYCRNWLTVDSWVNYLVCNQISYRSVNWNSMVY